MKKHSLAASVHFGAVFFLLTSCGTIKQEPFAAFSTSVGAAQTSMDQALSATSSWAKAGFLEEFSRSPKHQIEDLIIQTRGGYAWDYPKEPPYVQLDKVRKVLKDLNAEFAKYASLLASLAGNQITDPAAFEAMTKNLNANLRSLSSTVKEHLSNGEVALFSTLATESARLYIEKKRRSYLADTIKHNQANVEAYADSCSELVTVLASVYTKNYAAANEPLANKGAALKVAANAPGVTPEQLAKINADKKSVAQELLKLDENLTSELDVLKELNRSYSAIPEAHKELASVLEKPKGVLNNIQLLAEAAARLNRIYNDQKNAK